MVSCVAVLVFIFLFNLLLRIPKYLLTVRENLIFAGLSTPEPTQKRQNSISPGKIIDDAEPSNILQTVMDLCSPKNYFSDMIVPSSPFRLPKLGPFTKALLGHTGDDIDMRFGADPSPVGEQLRKHLSNASAKSVILLAKSGAGKTTAIFDAARLHWCILFTASSSQEDIGKVDPGGFDYSFANLVDFVLPVLDNTTLEDKQKDVDCNRYMNALVTSRLVVLFHFQGLSGATPEAWLPADWTSA
jgi:hypothetical protein